MATVTKRRKSYLIRASSGYTVDGKQVRPSITWRPDPGMTERQIEKELQRQMLLFDESCHGVTRTGGHVKFQRFAEEWMKSYGETALAIRTRDVYRQMFQRVNQSIGHLYVDKITPRQIRALMDELREPMLDHSSPSTTLNIYAHTFESAQARASEALAEKLPVKFAQQKKA